MLPGSGSIPLLFGRLGLTSRVRVFSVVRDPLMWFRSKVRHDLQAHLSHRYNSVVMRSSRRRTGAAPHSCGARIFPGLSTTGMDTVPPARLRRLRHRFMFGVSGADGAAFARSTFTFSGLMRRAATAASSQRNMGMHRQTNNRHQCHVRAEQAGVRAAAAGCSLARPPPCRDLVDDLQRIKLERNVDLLSCFSGEA